MKTPTNSFKRALKSGRPQYGFFNGLPHTYAAEICAGAGFDWVLIDAEHGPFDMSSVLHNLQSMASFDVPILVRPPEGNPVTLKQLLDAGVQSVLIPMVESAEQAALMVRAMRYPPAGIRGLGTGLARAAQWNRRTDYFEWADNEMCLLVQVESARGLSHLNEIASVDGVDGVFIGPSDLSASMGYIGQPGHPDMVSTIGQALETIRAAGKAAGVMALERSMIDHYVDCGANIVAVGLDALLLAQATTELAKSFR